MSRNGKGLMKFVAGVGLGVGLGMLLAPKSGEELRKDLKKKMDELIKKVKETDLKELSEDLMDKVNDLKREIEELDKEKVLAIAKKKGEQLKNKANDLWQLAKEKGTPVIEKAADEVRQRAILVTKEVLRKLENDSDVMKKETLNSK